VAIVVRRVLSYDWQALRDIRLSALLDSPTSFGSTYAREAAYGETEWRDWSRDSQRGAKSAMFLAWDGEDRVGIAGGFNNHERDCATVISMWVAPGARGKGVGRLLLDAVVDWAPSIQRDVVDLHVTVGNTAAQRLYESAGFLATNEFEPLPHDHGYTLSRMVLKLGPI
jgi:ribosomal protein S18 acetylase RimI-like enzyme